MVDENKVLSRLQRLEQTVAKLERIRRGGWDQFRTDTDLHDIADRNLQVAVECCADIANHVIATQGLRFPDSYSEAFAVLAEAGILPQALADDLSQAAGMRNIIVHGYLNIDRQRQFNSLSKVDDFRGFASAILDYLSHA